MMPIVLSRGCVIVGLMKFYLTSLVFISLVLVAVFGFAAMNHGGSIHCVASAVQGAACPNNALGFASFHLGFFKNFSSVSSETLAAAAILIALAVIAFFLKLSEEPPIFKKTAVQEASGGSSIVASPVRNIRQWLSLLENSPSGLLALR